ncbi:unnamed protein product [Clonostachys rosea f. rosea IK726]|uniref:FAD dependent oxidoreductase domain-containing protein n=2 Tax=Bionectria ochroleuca TaxID=29856 RepID=A0A0B7KF80_BIOOC|nr:unnamed protein product [Clonostachys rosea f. rosea IK726]
MTVAIVGNKPPFGPNIRVAVIGSGISGISTAAHLLRQGVKVTVFERSGEPGGIWNYKETPSPGPSYPSVRPSADDYSYLAPHHETKGMSGFSAGQDAVCHANESRNGESFFAPSSACYAGLYTNIPTSLMYPSLKSWPEETPNLVPHSAVNGFLQTLSAEFGVNRVTEYWTRVESAVKNQDGQGWRLLTEMPVTDKASNEVVEKSWEFDAVVVASGHYNLPRVPDIPGLAELKGLYPGRVIHSKQYRRPEAYRDSAVLIVGGGVSAMDISRELSHTAASVTQSTRGGDFDLPERLIPKSVRRVAGISKFSWATDSVDLGQSHRNGPINVTLSDGSELRGLDHVILATGYLFSFPFLPQFHSDETPAAAVDSATLVGTEGDMVHNLYKDMFYIDDPTLVFVGLPYHVVTFSTFDYQAQIAARVLSGLSSLPSGTQMRSEYDQRVKASGFGLRFHSQGEGDAELRYMRELIELVSQGDKGSGEPLLAPSAKWLKSYAAFKEGLKG